MNEHRECLSGLYRELETYMENLRLYEEDEDEEGREEEGEEEGEEEEGEEEEEEEEDDDDEEEEEILDDDDIDSENEEDWEDEDEDSNSSAHPKSKKVAKKTKPERETLVTILNHITSALREAINDANCSESDTADLVAEVDRIFSKAMVFAYDDDSGGPYAQSHVPSFAHDNSCVDPSEEQGKKCAPLLRDASKLDDAYHFSGMFLPHMDSFLRIFKDLIDPEKVPGTLKVAPGWKDTFRPHPLSSPCARFRDTTADIDTSTAWGVPSPDSHPIATAVLQARAEISSINTREPSSAILSASGETLAMSFMSGYKRRIPHATLFRLNEETDGGGIRGTSIRLDLTSGASEMVLDEPEQEGEDTLLFVGDWERVKSYRCFMANSGQGKTRRVHTLASTEYDGPMTVLPSSTGKKIFRLGKGGRIAVWDLSTLPTHGVDAEGKNIIIGTRIAEEDLNTWRDDPESIERSSGSVPTSHVQLDLGEEYVHAQKNIDGNGVTEIGVWHHHPGRPNTMLCGGGKNNRNGNYFCHAFDLERGGKPVSRYLGHGGVVEGFSTEAARDPNVFLTWATDGHVRLFDTRVVLPVLTIAATPGSQLDYVNAAALAHPDGIPFIFTSSIRTECIKVWDVRAQASVYELATGNNFVNDLAWDGRTNTLLASTMCEHLDINAPGGGYRLAQIPKVKVYADGAATGAPPGSQAANAEEDGDDSEKEDEDDEEEEEEYEAPDDYKSWPNRAVHRENYFGHVFDSGSHRIFKYKFKPDPDCTILPAYGHNTPTVQRREGAGRSSGGGGFASLFDLF